MYVDAPPFILNNYRTMIFSKLLIVLRLVRWLKNGSFGFAEGSALCVGAKPNVPFVRLAKIVFKKVRWGKK